MVFVCLFVLLQHIFTNMRRRQDLYCDHRARGANTQPHMVSLTVAYWNENEESWSSNTFY